MSVQLPLLDRLPPRNEWVKMYWDDTPGGIPVGQLVWMENGWLFYHSSTKSQPHAPTGAPGGIDYGTIRFLSRRFSEIKKFVMHFNRTKKTAPDKPRGYVDGAADWWEIDFWKLVELTRNHPEWRVKRCEIHSTKQVRDRIFIPGEHWTRRSVDSRVDPYIANSIEDSIFPNGELWVRRW